MNIGLGQITPEIFYTVINESNILVKYLRVKSNQQVPVYQKDYENYHPNKGPGTDLLRLLNEELFQDEKTRQELRALVRTTSSLGCESLNTEMG